MSNKNDTPDEINESITTGEAITTANLPGLFFTEDGALLMGLSKDTLKTSTTLVTEPNLVAAPLPAKAVIGIAELMRADTAEASLANDGWPPIP
jgi:hypothetical protein